MTTQPSIDQADNVARALEALRARWGQSPEAGAADQKVLQQASEVIAQLRDLVSTMDGQLAAMRVLARSSFGRRASTSLRVSWRSICSAF